VDELVLVLLVEELLLVTPASPPLALLLVAATMLPTVAAPVVPAPPLDLDANRLSSTPPQPCAAIIAGRTTMKQAAARERAMATMAQSIPSLTAQGLAGLRKPLRRKPLRGASAKRASCGASCGVLRADRRWRAPCNPAGHTGRPRP
jgi:hypothetical protein